MQFLNPLNKFCESPISVWTAQSVAALPRPLREHLAEAINAMGVASAKAQGLSLAITEMGRFMHSGDTLFVALEGVATVSGILRIGRKNLFVRDAHGGLHECAGALCVLDFYVHETRQRQGIGKQLLDHMLARQNDVAPSKLAYDRPSPKLIAFLAKNYGLTSPLLQSNNFVVFRPFFDAINPKGSTPVPDGYANAGPGPAPATAGKPNHYSARSNANYYGGYTATAVGVTTSGGIGAGVAAAGGAGNRRRSMPLTLNASNAGLGAKEALTEHDNHFGAGAGFGAAAAAAGGVTQAPGFPASPQRVGRGKYPNQYSAEAPYGTFSEAKGSAYRAVPSNATAATGAFAPAPLASAPGFPPATTFPAGSSASAAAPAAGGGAPGPFVGDVGAGYAFTHHSSSNQQLHTSATHVRHASQPYTNTSATDAYRPPQPPTAAAASAQPSYAAAGAGAGAGVGAGAPGGGGAGAVVHGRFESRDPDYVSPLYAHAIVTAPDRYTQLTAHERALGEVVAARMHDAAPPPQPLSPQQRQQRFSRTNERGPQPAYPYAAGMAAPAPAAPAPAAGSSSSSLAAAGKSTVYYPRPHPPAQRAGSMRDVFYQPTSNTDTEAISLHRQTAKTGALSARTAVGGHAGTLPPAPMSPSNGPGIGGAARYRAAASAAAALPDYVPFKKPPPPSPTAGAGAELRSIENSIHALNASIAHKQSQILAHAPATSAQSYDARTNLSGFSKGQAQLQYYEQKQKALQTLNAQPPAVAPTSSSAVLNATAAGSLAGASAERDGYGVGGGVEAPSSFATFGPITSYHAFPSTGAEASVSAGYNAAAKQSAVQQSIAAAAAKQHAFVSQPPPPRIRPGSRGADSGLSSAGAAIVGGAGSGAAGGAGAGAGDEYGDANGHGGAAFASTHRVRTADATSLQFAQKPFAPPGPVHFSHHRNAPTPPHHYVPPADAVQLSANDLYMHKTKPQLQPSTHTQAFTENARNTFQATLRNGYASK